MTPDHTERCSADLAPELGAQSPPDSPPAELAPELAGTMWADLFTAELHARSAQYHVTRRALTYLAVGLDLGQVLDALKIDAAEWATRVEGFEAWAEENRRAADRLDRGRVGR